MILFWLLCALLVAIALAFVLPPLIENDDKSQDNGGDSKDANLAVYRDQMAELERDTANGLIGRAQLEQDRNELERRLLEDVSATSDVTPEPSNPVMTNRNYVYLVAFGIPVLAVAMYLQVGNLNAMSSAPTPTGRESAQEAPEEMPQGENAQRSRADIEANVAGLAKRLEENPNDLQGWIMLGRSYMSFEKYSDASTAYAKANELKPNDPGLMADYAFALAMTNGQRLEGKPAELINKALKLDPENVKVLELAGTVAFEEKDYKRALQHWQKLMSKIPPESEAAQALSQRIEETKTLAGNNK